MEIGPEDIKETQKLFAKGAEAALDFQLEQAVLKTPFKKIAMALSGGGFRAAAYSLGAMSYLHYLKYPTETGKVSVLDNVEFISSASGGTITGILYSMHVRMGVSFETTYDTLLNFMNGQGLLENVLKRINDESKWQGDKSRNFINAFAGVYNDDLFNQQTFGIYWQKAKEINPRPMEVCFNTTEFYRGLPFRFQAKNESKSFSKTGNAYVFFNKQNPKALETLQLIRLGDILAASSCFPGGFEPILFPMDFGYKITNDKSLGLEDLSNALIVNDYNNKPISHYGNIGFMDGGIDDNQGVYSAMVADERRRKIDAGNGFDLIFVTDVASYFMDAYEAPLIDNQDGIRKDTIFSVIGFLNKGFKRINGIVTGIIIGSLIFLAISLALLFFVPNILPHDLLVVLAAISGTMFFTAFLVKKLLLNHPLFKKIQQAFSLRNEHLVQLIKKQLPALKNFSDAAIDLLITYLQKTPLGVLEQMLKARINSTLSIVMDINLKQTRRLIFDIFFGNFYGKDTWEHRRVFNVIYELSSFNRLSRLSILENKLSNTIYKLPLPEDQLDDWERKSIEMLTQGCDHLQIVAERARTMGTSLWFDQQDANAERMQDVVACGQFTTCVKLLEYAIIVERQIEIQLKNPSATKVIDLNTQQLEIFKNIKQQLEHDWIRFKKDPYFLANIYDSQRG